MITVFLDLDGTIINTAERHYRVYQRILESNQSGDPLPKKEFWEKKRRGLKTNELLPGATSLRQKRDFNSEWRALIEKKEFLKLDTLVGSARRCLQSLDGEADIVYVTLRAKPRNLFWEIRRLDVARYAKHVLIAPPESKSKTKMIKRYSSHMSEGMSYVIVGDSEIDVVTGKEMGIPVIAVSHGLRSEIYLKRWIPDRLVRGLTEIPSLVTSLSRPVRPSRASQGTP